MPVAAAAISEDDRVLFAGAAVSVAEEEEEEEEVVEAFGFHVRDLAVDDPAAFAYLGCVEVVWAAFAAP